MNVAQRALISALVHAQEGRCAYCRTPMDRMRTITRQGNRNRPTLDHVVPVSLGGANARGNFLAAHARCNEEKAGRWPTNEELEYLAVINRRLGWTCEEAA